MKQSSLRVERLEVRVRLGEPAPVLALAEAAAAAGDESWERWVAEYRRGEALIVFLDVTLTVVTPEREYIRIGNRGVFVEKDPELPKIEQQVAEVVSLDFSLLAEQLIARGYSFDPRLLNEMYVHVELDDDVISELAEPGARPKRGVSDSEIGSDAPDNSQIRL